jgi:hypothetical protein
LYGAGIAFKRDDEAFNAGVLRLELSMEAEGERFPLIVTFPDLYPYFRFQVDAPTLELHHHQNPFFKNLCLLGRGTHHWRTTDTVASLLRAQLWRVLMTGRELAKEVVEGIEHQQAEPYSDYYVYPSSMVVLPKTGIFPSQLSGGHFTVATAGPAGPPPENLLRGIVSKVRDSSNNPLFSADAKLLVPFGGAILDGYWVRSSAPIAHVDHELFLKALLKNFPAAYSARINKVPGGWLQIWGVVFPEEHAWRQLGDDGIVFVCLFNANRKKMAQIVRGPQPPNRGSSKGKNKPR